MFENNQIQNRRNLIKSNMNQMLGETIINGSSGDFEIIYEGDFAKAADSENWSVFGVNEVNDFIRDSGGLQKAKKDLSNLQKKVITNSKGHRMTVWVKKEQGEPEKKKRSHKRHGEHVQHEDGIVKGDKVSFKSRKHGELVGEVRTMKKNNHSSGYAYIVVTMPDGKKKQFDISLKNIKKHDEDTLSPAAKHVDERLKKQRSIYGVDQIKKIHTFKEGKQDTAYFDMKNGSVVGMKNGGEVSKYIGEVKSSEPSKISEGTKPKIKGGKSSDKKAI